MMKGLIFCLVTFFVCNIQLNAQQFADDMALIKSKAFYTAEEFAYYRGDKNDQHVFETHHRNVAATYNPVTMTFKGLMLVYQNVLSPQLARTCPYEITCSNFCKQSIKEYGMVKGLVMGADRIMRCTRLGLLDISFTDINLLTGKLQDSPSTYR